MKIKFFINIKNKINHIIKAIMWSVELARRK